MLRPITYWWPMMRIACRMAVRTIGSPLRLISRPSVDRKFLCALSDNATSFPVSISPQVEALTSTDELLPRCDSQSASPSLSAISFSAVSSSGMRSNASARHIRTTPSSEERSYSCMKASSKPCSALRARTEPTSAQARWLTRSSDSGSKRARASSLRTTSASSAWYRRLISSLGGLDGGGLGSRKSQTRRSFTKNSPM